MKTENSSGGKLTEPQDISIVEFNRLICAIHEGSFDEAAFAHALDMIRLHFDANFVALIFRISSVQDIGLMLVSDDSNTHSRLTYGVYHHRLSPFASQPVNKVFTQQDVVPVTEWEETDYYQMTCLHENIYHLMCANISTDLASVFRFKVTRPKSGAAFSADDKALCQLLLPHLRQALHAHNMLGRSESLGDHYADVINRLSVATILLTESGIVQKMNDHARQLLDRADGLKLTGNRIVASYPRDNKELQSHIKSAFEARANGRTLTGKALSIARPSGEVNLGIVSEAVVDSSWLDDSGQPALLLYVRDAVNRHIFNIAAGTKLFDLTLAETRLALELANGRSLEDAAEHLDIMVNTARAHLRAIFSKTGIRRQAELVRVVLNSVVALSADAPRPGVVIPNTQQLDQRLKPRE